MLAFRRQRGNSMLTHLYLKDFAVVSEAEIDFGPGLTVVSGETGAGKSLMVDALLLLGGARADSGVVRHGAQRAELSASFDLADAGPAREWLRAQELDTEAGECQLRRIIRADGGSRAWINGRPATAGQLSDLGERLLEIHGQHEHQALLSRIHQLALLDGFGGHDDALAEVATHARHWRSIQRRLAEIESAGNVEERIDYLDHQVRELDAETLEPEAIAALFAQHKRLANASSLIEGCGRGSEALAGEDGAAPADTLRAVQASLARLASDEPRLGEVVDLLEGAAVQVEEAAAALERVRDELELDPEQLQDLEHRMTRLHELARKHRTRVDELHEHRESLRLELEGLRDAVGGLDALRQALDQAAGNWREAATTLGGKRARAGNRLGKAVSALMDELGMSGGRFEVALEPLEGDEPDPNGAERVELMVSANPGMPLRPLRRVASGGELSRISLAIEVASLDRDAVATMVFDEVDTGIGGGVAEVVGQRLRALGSRRQVLCVTHLPQVAAQGHGHYRVDKQVQGQATHTRVSRLDADARIEEVSRMLGGLEITSETRAHARQMLERAAAEDA
jgi:DNA repair protein RecN (Recombination protein N)